jgi:hypothetical protein
MSLARADGTDLFDRGAIDQGRLRRLIERIEEVELRLRQLRLVGEQPRRKLRTDAPAG